MERRSCSRRSCSRRLRLGCLGRLLGLGRLGLGRLVGPGRLLGLGLGRGRPSRSSTQRRLGLGRLFGLGLGLGRLDLLDLVLEREL